MIPVWEKCPPSSGSCTYTCSVVEIENVMNADLKTRVKIYFGPNLLFEDTGDGSKGNVMIVTREWD